MKIKRMSISFTFAANLGNYENVKPAATFEVDVEDGDTDDAILMRADELMAEAQAVCAASLWPIVENDLQSVSWRPKDDEKDHIARARRLSAAFRWAHTLNEDATTELLLDLIEEKVERERVEQEKAAQERAEEQPGIMVATPEYIGEHIAAEYEEDGDDDVDDDAYDDANGDEVDEI